MPIQILRARRTERGYYFRVWLDTTAFAPDGTTPLPAAVVVIERERLDRQENETQPAFAARLAAYEAAMITELRTEVRKRARNWRAVRDGGVEGELAPLAVEGETFT